MLETRSPLTTVRAVRAETTVSHPLPPGCATASKIPARRYSAFSRNTARESAKMGSRARLAHQTASQWAARRISDGDEFGLINYVRGWGPLLNNVDRRAAGGWDVSFDARSAMPLWHRSSAINRQAEREESVGITGWTMNHGYATREGREFGREA